MPRKVTVAVAPHGRAHSAVLQTRRRVDGPVGTRLERLRGRCCRSRTSQPPRRPGQAGKSKTGKVDASALMRQGVKQTLTLVRTRARRNYHHRRRTHRPACSAETLRAERLRRMSARLLELAASLSNAARDYAALYTEITERRWRIFGWPRAACRSISTRRLFPSNTWKHSSDARGPKIDSCARP